MRLAPTFLFATAAVPLLAAASCSLTNAPDELAEPPATTTTTGSGGSGGTGGAAAECSKPADCVVSDKCKKFDCQAGKCVYPDVNIDDDDACTTDACDPDTGPTHTPVDTSDGKACTTDSCDPATGVMHVIRDDGDPCTTDECDPTTGAEVHAPIAAIDDGILCTTDLCDSSTGNITHTPIPTCTCGHSLCEPGPALEADKCSWGAGNECAKAVCAQDASCCDPSGTTGWTAACVDLVKTQSVCGTGIVTKPKYSCTCAHSYCEQGDALSATCDPCVKKVCELLPECCDVGPPAKPWSAACVKAVNDNCNDPCSPSCAGSGVGAGDDCDPAGGSDCCARPLVTGGSFVRGYDDATYTDQTFTATVSDFRLDKYEVTVGRFRQFVEAGKGTSPIGSAPGIGTGEHPKIAGSGWDGAWNQELAPNKAALMSALKCDPSYATWTDAEGASEKKPINCVTWYEAFAFCVWDGARLATETEWNYVSAGGGGADGQRIYPWSVPSTNATIAASYAVFNCNEGGGTCSSGLGEILGVGSKSPKGDGKWGQSDLAGSVAEWALDLYASPFADVPPCIDCANLTSGTDRAVRGGSFQSAANDVIVSFRVSAAPDQRSADIGIRCARNP